MRKLVLAAILLSIFFLTLPTQHGSPTMGYAQAETQTPVAQPIALAQRTPQAGQPTSDAAVLSIAGLWVNALDTRDFQAALSLLDDNSYLTYLPPPDRDGITTYSGKTEIATAFQIYSAENVRVRLIGEPTIEHGTLTWTEGQSSDSLRQIGLVGVQVTANAIVQNGKLKSIIYELDQESALQLAEALGRASNGPLSPYIAELVGQAATVTGPVPPNMGMPSTGHGGTLPDMLSLLIVSALALAAGLLLHHFQRRLHPRETTRRNGPVREHSANREAH